MGALWTAWNQQLDVPVAVKFMSPETVASSELVARFEREAKAAAQMRIPQVVQIFEYGVYSDVPFMAMELLEGEDLGKRLRVRGRLSLVETARVVGEVAKALRRAHELGVIHRDLKPANVFLARSGDEETVKVLDFGVAKLLGEAAGEDATRTGALIGTPHYMSPEQARRTSRGVDHRSDLWSLGVIAFRAVTGKLPFAGDDPVDVLVRICTERAPPASSVAPDVGQAVDWFFARALAFDPEQRFQSAREMADALNTIADPTTVQAAGWGAPRPSMVSLPHAPPGPPMYGAGPYAPAGGFAPHAPAGPYHTPAPASSPATLTSAATEVPAQPRRTSLVVVVLGAAALAVLVGAGLLTAGLSSSDGGAGPAVEPPPAAVSAPDPASAAQPAQAPEPGPSASGESTPPAPEPVATGASEPSAAATTPPRASSTAPAAPKPAASASARPTSTRTQGASKPGSAIFADPVFRP